MNAAKLLLGLAVLFAALPAAPPAFAKAPAPPKAGAKKPADKASPEQLRIAKACVAAGQRQPHPLKTLEKTCACIARRHVKAAAQEPDPAEAKRQLAWVARYYEESDDAKRDALTNDPDSISDVDYEIAEACSKP